MKCEVCGKTVVQDGVTLHRVSPLGETGVWRCQNCLTPEQSAAVDPGVQDVVRILSTPASPKTDWGGLEQRLECWKETLGKKAYEAYCGSRGWKAFDNKPLPKWEEVKLEIKQGWIVSAVEVVRFWHETQF